MEPFKPSRINPSKNKAFKQQLKAQAHHLKVILQTGKEGMSESFKKAVDTALKDHELLKIRMASLEQENKSSLLKALCEYCKATLVTTIGHVAVLYRPITKKQDKSAK